MKRIVFTATFLLATVLAASAQDAPNNLDGSRIIRRMEHRLNVTDAQRVQLKAILQQERPTLEQLHTQLAAEHAELVALPSFNEAETRAIAAKYADTNTAALVEREKLRVEIFAILTPAQQQKLNELRARFGGAVDQRLQTLGDNL